MSTSTNSRALDVISPENNEKINEYIDEVKDIFKTKMSTEELGILIDEQRAKIFRDIETQFDYYGSLDVDFILERRMKMLINSLQQDEQVEKLFSFNLGRLRDWSSIFRSDRKSKPELVSIDSEIQPSSRDMTIPSALLFLFPLLSLTFINFDGIKDGLLIIVMILFGLTNLFYVNRIDGSRVFANVLMYMVTLVFISDFASYGEPQYFLYSGGNRHGGEEIIELNWDNLILYGSLLYGFWLFSISYKIFSRIQLRSRFDNSINQISMLLKITISIFATLVFTSLAVIIMIGQYDIVRTRDGSGAITELLLFEAVLLLITTSLLMVPISRKLNSNEKFTIVYGKEMTLDDSKEPSSVQGSNIYNLDTMVILKIDEKKVKSYYGLRNRLFRKSTFFLTTLIFLVGLLLFRLDNTSDNIYERYAHDLYIENTAKYTREVMILLLAMVWILLTALLLLIIVTGVIVWLVRIGSKDVIRNLYLLNKIEMHYKVLLTPPQGLSRGQYTSNISKLLYNNIIMIGSKLEVEG